MKTSNRRRRILCAWAGAAILAGCSGNGGPQSTLPPLSPTAQNSTRLGTNARSHKASWMAAGATGSLLYVSDYEAQAVDVYSYPQAKLVGALTGVGGPGGLCVDKKGDVFVTEPSSIAEFAHGGTTPIATLGDSEEPAACAVDRMTGDLAVVNGGNGSGNSLWIYPHGQGTPSVYADPNLDALYYCAYDNAGDLFVDGVNTAFATELDELSSGANEFTPIKLNQTIVNPGAVQYDGREVAVGDMGAQPQVIYEFTISGNSGTLASQTTLNGAQQIDQFWIQGSKVVGADVGLGTVPFYNYPGGGNPTKTISGLYEPVGVAVSK